MELIESPEELLLLIEFRARGILNMASYLIPGIAGAAPIHLRGAKGVAGGLVCHSTPVL